MNAAFVDWRYTVAFLAFGIPHTCASDVLDHSKDLRAVQEMLGHRHLQTTAVYLRRADLGRLRDAMAGRRYLVA